MPRTRTELPSPLEIHDRRLATAFAGLLAELGLGNLRTDDFALIDLIERAKASAHRLRAEANEASARANRLQVHVEAPRPTESARRHLVQWRVLTKDDGVVWRSEWEPDGSPEALLQKQFADREMVMGDDLRLSRLVRCVHFEITSEARPDDEPPF